MPWGETFSLIVIRSRLLIRQKLGLISLAVGLLLVLLSLTVARVSFVNPEKIFWDFSLAASFILQVCLALFLGSQLFSDERARRTLHLILSGGVSRFSWLLGNGLGIWLVLTFMNALWFLLSVLVCYFVFGSFNVLMAFQAEILLSVEVLLLVYMGLFVSLFLRPLLSLVVCFVLTVFLHSLSSLQRVFTDPQVGRYVEDGGASFVLWAARLLPPLEWLDLKTFVGYQDSVSWLLVCEMGALGLCWAMLLATAAWLRFERMDL
jgi:ABC-type transport system involved in multi-copper enzyme maturation permease subunit